MCEAAVTQVSVNNETCNHLHACNFDLTPIKELVMVYHGTTFGPVDLH